MCVLVCRQCVDETSPGEKICFMNDQHRKRAIQCMSSEQNYTRTYRNQRSDYVLYVTLTQPSLFKHGCSSAPSAILLPQQEANTIKIKAVHLWEGFRKLHTSSDSEDSAENWSWHTWTHVQPQGLKNQEWGSEKKLIEGLFPASWLTMKITKTGQKILIFTLNSSVSDAEYFTPAAEVGLFS